MPNINFRPRIDVGHVEIDVDVVDNPPGPPTKVLRMSAHVSACQSQWINTIFKGTNERGGAGALAPARKCLTPAEAGRLP